MTAPDEPTHHSEENTEHAPDAGDDVDQLGRTFHAFSDDPPPPRRPMAGIKAFADLLAPTGTKSGDQLAVPGDAGQEVTEPSLPLMTAQMRVAGYEILGVLGRG